MCYFGECDGLLTESIIRVKIHIRKEKKEVILLATGSENEFYL